MTFNHVSLLLAQATQTQANPAGEMFKMVMTFGIMGIALYFVMIRPQQKRAKEHQNLLTTLKPGDKVLLSGGIVGAVVTVKEKTVSVRSADSKFEVLKSAITEITERGSGSETTESK
jgi:preprotein translocase subunit YajC